MWYKLGDVLGQGGFGITYLAEDSNLKRPVAIKEFLPTEVVGRADDGTVEPLSEEAGELYRWCFDRFAIEAQTLARFRHPNIVQVLSVFQANATAYMVMEYVEGLTFDQALAANKFTTESALLNVTLQMLDGLEMVHQEGFIHRDLKPANILIREDDTPLLLDFGSARFAMGAETRTLTAMVSPGYAPIEQYGGGSADKENKQGPWTDLYGLGATLYRAVSGRGPVDAAIRVNGFLAGSDVLESAASAGKGRFSDSFLQAIDAAIAIRPMDRPQTVAQWREMLLRGAPMASKIPPSPSPAHPSTTLNLSLGSTPPTQAVDEVVRTVHGDSTPPSVSAPKSHRSARQSSQTDLPTVRLDATATVNAGLQDQLLKELEEWKSDHDEGVEKLQLEEQQREGRRAKQQRVEEIKEEHAYTHLLDAL
ncbi:MAG: serine/threonine protein kinase, partial [Chromatiales bacterium]|nr:serine/threonine protein kinase [Chromatiales bacterium]